MKILGKYSHLNGEEYLIVHHKKLYKEILNVVESVDALKLRTKISKEKGRKEGKALRTVAGYRSQLKRRTR